LASNWWWLVGLLALLDIVVIFVLWKVRLSRKSDKSLSIGLDIIAAGSEKVVCGDMICGDKNIASPKKPEWYEILEEELERIPVGRVVFNPPEEMKVGIIERIEVRISKNAETDLISALKGRGIAQIENIKVSELMKVRVSGRDFDITSLNEEEQFIDTQGFTEWAWDIVPKKSGNKIIHLHVTLRIRLPFGEERKDHPVLDKEVIVKVNPFYSTRIFI